MVGLLESWANVFDVHVIGFEYPGYGITPDDSTPSENGCYQAADVALDYVVRELRVPNRRVIIFGQSLGSGVAVDLAARNQCGGLLLISPLLSAIRTHACECFACMCRCGDFFSSIYKIDKIESRCLIIHGTQDEVVPFSHGEHLYSMLKKPHEPLWVEGAGHNDLLEIGTHSIPRSIRGFLDSCVEDLRRAEKETASNLRGDEGYQGKELPLF